MVDNDGSAYWTVVGGLGRGAIGGLFPSLVPSDPKCPCPSCAP